MYLKQIEIHGFKSFANDTVLNFERGITAIVGPNGSGKSNIADAVRWVLGEQKVKQLRSSNMQDVIFSGTELRKAQSFAYVSLVIDNSDRKLSLDFDEVQVSRRLYRSGDSEYKLNGTECRLKDINEIFYDTGIGKEGYSIIGQGQIDKILSNKPEDRRELFDEAVGIVKYKRRKAIAEKKLEEEQLNLSRVSDIMSELEKQVEPLRKQAEDAKIYLSLREQLILHMSNYLVREIDKETENIKNLNENLLIVKSDLKEVNKNKEEFNQKYAEIDSEISKLDVHVAYLKDSLSDNNTKKENFIGKINVIKEQINFENESNQSRTDRINVLNNYIFDIISKIETSTSIINALKKQLMIIKQNNTNIDDTKDLDKNINKINEKIDFAIEKVRIYMGDDYLFDINSTPEKTASDEILASVNDKKSELDELNLTIDDLTLQTKNLSDQLINKSRELENINNNILNSQSVYHGYETKLETIKNMIDRYDGYNNTVKIIMDNRDRFAGIKGVVADLINTEPKYEVAIEVAIAGALQNIVTSNIDDSKKIIEYLKEQKLGRLTLLPLTTLTPKENNKYINAKNEVGVIDIAKNLVRYENEYEKLAEYLLSRCLIVDNFDNANNLNRKYNHSLKIVTLSGEIFNPGGSVSGGAYKNSLNLIGRNREYDELKIKIVDKKNEIDNLNIQKANTTTAYDTIQRNIEKNKNELSNLLVKKNTLTLNIVNELKLKYSNMISQFEYSATDLDRLYGELDNYFQEKAGLEDKGKDSIESVEKKQLDIENINKEITDINNEIDKINQEIISNINKKEELLQNRNEYYESKDRIANELISLEQEQFKLNSNIEKSTQKIQEVTQKSFDEYQLTYESAKEKFIEDFGSIQDIKNKMSEIRKDMTALGDVNVRSIEEFKNVSDRYGLMLSQYDDLKKSEEMILKIVEELDENMKKQFDENFKFIKTEFDKVFKELFGGGKATLELMDDGVDKLEAGVQINVQPPGKKLGNLSQLSGGERAMTAIALLFAIQNLKPSPFCLLDEIEAALDESNVDRFADYLKNLIKDTQFILITHRRGTMENADRLYGVTMQEKGVTSLVSVNLVEEQLD